MHRIAKLRDEHTRLIALVGRLNVVIAADAPPPGVELQTLRLDLATTLIGHLKSEDWLLYPDLLDNSDPRIVLLARRFCAEMGDLSKAFLDYSERWMKVPIGEYWTDFCRETRAITDALIERIEREDRLLYPLLGTLDQAA